MRKKALIVLTPILKTPNTMKKCFALLKKAIVFILTAAAYAKNAKFTENTGLTTMIIASKPAACKANQNAARRRTV